MFIYWLGGATLMLLMNDMTAFWACIVLANVVFITDRIENRLKLLEK